MGVKNEKSYMIRANILPMLIATDAKHRLFGILLSSLARVVVGRGGGLVCIGRGVAGLGLLWLLLLLFPRRWRRFRLLVQKRFRCDKVWFCHRHLEGLRRERVQVKVETLKFR